MANLILKNNTAANDVMVEFNRGSNSNWRLVNSGGNLSAQCNYTDSAGSYYKVLELFYKSGNATLKGGLTLNGSLTLNKSTITGSSTTTSFTVPDTSGSFVICPTKGTAVGGSTAPVYVASTGVLTVCSTYAGGTKVTLNGSDKGASTASFYAPTSAGTSGYILKSAGSGAPTWASLADIADSRYVNVTGDTMTGPLKINPGSASDWTEGIRIAPASNGWTSLVLGSSAVSGTGTGAWSFHTYSNHFYLSHNGSSNGSPMLIGIPNDGFSVSGNFSIKGSSGNTNLKFISSGDSTNAYITYNHSNQCLDFTFG